VKLTYGDLLARIAMLENEIVENLIKIAELEKKLENRQTTLDIMSFDRVNGEN